MGSELRRQSTIGRIQLRRPVRRRERNRVKSARSRTISLGLSTTSLGPSHPSGITLMSRSISIVRERSMKALIQRNDNPLGIDAHRGAWPSAIVRQRWQTWVMGNQAGYRRWRLLDASMQKVKMYVKSSTGSAWKLAVQGGWDVDNKFGASLIDGCL